MPPMLAKVRAANLWALSLVAVATVAMVAPRTSTTPPSLSTESAALAAANTWLSLARTGSSPCVADICGKWSGEISFQVVDSGDQAHSVRASTLAGAFSGNTTTKGGAFIWYARGAKACRLVMTSYRAGRAIVALGAPNEASSLEAP
jgi:hypothetical protein